MSDQFRDETRTADFDPRWRDLRTVQQLHIEWSDRAGAHRISTSSELCMIGSGAGNEVVVADPTVSELHCELRIEPNRVRIVDLGSHNGTRVDGVRVFDACVGDRSVIQVGATVLTVTASGDVTVVQMSGSDHFGELVGASPVMRTMFAKLERAAASDATVLLDGETGTGKEGVAEALHRASPRANGPLVVVDCSSIPETLFASELFGHERGSFTGALTTRVGAMESANGGTLFLDEIGELPIDMQPKLLRALESRTIRRIGSNERIALDVRVVAATHRRLRREVSEGRFRSDLFFRLAVLTIEIPPLRDHLEDLPLLVDALSRRLGVTDAQRSWLLSARFIERLAAKDWPGNVRELRNELERAIVLDAADQEPGSAAAVSTRMPFGAARRIAVASFERSYLATILEEHGGVVAQAARAAAIDRVHFHRLVRKHRLRAV